MKQLQTLKGFRDFLPPEAKQRQWLKAKIMAVFERWGFEPLETPTLESLELFQGQIGEDEKLFYKFEDQGGRQVALRYDQTVPLCRVMAQYGNQLTLPFKRYQIQPAFRAEKPQKGRYREFLQCDADIMGTASPLADAEVIALGLDICRQLGFKQARARINDRQLLAGIPYPAISSIDKLDKLGRDGVLKDMENKGISLADATNYLDIITQKIKPNQTLTTIFDYLKSQGFSADWYQFDPTIARSFSYSDGPIWEIEIPNWEGGSVLGGERFDGLTKQISGIDMPGTGFGLGFDRTLEAAQAQGLTPTVTSTTQVLVTIFDQKRIDASVQTAAKLRAQGISTEMYPALDKLPKQLKYANKKGIPWVIVIGDQEAANQQVALKNMSTGEQVSLSLEKAITQLK